MATVKLDYNKTIQQANRCQFAGLNFREHVAKVKQLAAALPEYWQGSSGSAMQGKLEEWAKEQDNLDKLCMDLSRTIRTVAKDALDKDKLAANQM